MRKIRQQLLALIESARQQHQLHMPPPRLQAALLHQAMQLLPLPNSNEAKKTTNISAQTLSQHNLHRHLILIRCPDQAFYLDALKGYLIQKNIQPLAQQTMVLSMQCSDAACELELRQPQSQEPSNFMFIALHLSTTLIEDCQPLTDDMQAILHAVELSIHDFPTMTQQLTRISEAIHNHSPHHAALLHWMNDGRYLIFGMQNATLKPEASKRVQRWGLMRQQRILNKIIPLFHTQLEAFDAPCDEGMNWLHISAMQHHIYSTTRVELLRIIWKNKQNISMESTIIGHFSRSARHANASQTPSILQAWQQLSQLPLLQQSAFYLREIRTLFDRMPKSMLCSMPMQTWITPLRQTVDLTVPTHMVVHRLHPAHGNIDYLFIAMHSRRFGPNIMHHILSALDDMKLVVHNHDSFGIGPYRILFIPIESNSPWPNIEHLQAHLQACIIFWKDHARSHLLEQTEGINVPHALQEIEQIPRLYQEIFSPETFLKHYQLRNHILQDGRVHVCIETINTGIEIQILSHTLIPLGLLIDHIQGFGLVATQETDVDFGKAEQTVHISRIRCRAPDTFPMQDIARLQTALQAVLNDESDHDSLNALLTSTSLNIRDIAVLLSLRNHIIQLIPEAGILSLSHVMLHYPKVSAALYDMFAAQHRLLMDDDTSIQAQQHFEETMIEVTHLSDDRWFHALASLITASLRTNAFVRQLHEPIAIKFDTTQLDFAPRPRPFREIFVHGLHVEGVHLRAGAVARGGIRYSDRPHDFRTEVLELMSTQVVKNGQIVPTGSKGGFVIRDGKGAAFLLQQYRAFIRALLSLTDNLVQQQIEPPQGIKIANNDVHDPYLVVAADKGTARFSDDANDEAQHAHFWLDDAFASGGQYGYDHKVFGITARGAWTCAAHHFQQLHQDAYLDAISIIGIGDMGGDVFGNGMLINPNIRLLAAFNHRHIFLDPNPDSQQAFAERTRLFQGVLGWGDYQGESISQGGGVFERNAKSIVISPEVQQALSIEVTQMSGEALIQAMLSAPVDMLYNGGIGTYVKASSESHAQVQDPANDAVRMDATALRCLVVCEGGNLGFTQRARIEYAKKGGLIHTDAIDNAAGVNMSDHEVNVKILFTDTHLQDITISKRNRLLHSMGEHISEQCLNDNQTQAEALALTHMDAQVHLPRLLLLRDTLLKTSRLDRRIDPGFNEDEPLVLLPQLAVMLGHEKNRIHDALDDEAFDTWSHFSHSMLMDYFPPLLRRRYSDAIAAHPLKSGISHTQITNHIINHFGMITIHHIQSLMDVSISNICEALLIAEQWLNLATFRKQLKVSTLAIQSRHVLQLQVQEHTLHLAEELLRLFDIKALDTLWLKKQQKSMQHFHNALDKHDTASDIPLETEVKRIGILSHMATAIYLHHTHHQPIKACFQATQSSLQCLPFVQLEDALSQADWGGSETHPLRCEWLNRLTMLKTKAAAIILAWPKKQRDNIQAMTWSSHPHWQALQDYQHHDDPDTYKHNKTPMQLILLLTQLESLLQS
ncbi:MAG: NAD-glutamate dehydrogenase [Zetaproteobacteria bacterium]|nr:NAD-glutamate dehydrogenase [Zetaproteobacteria bacterium]